MYAARNRQLMLCMAIFVCYISPSGSRFSLVIIHFIFFFFHRRVQDLFTPIFSLLFFFIFSCCSLYLLRHSFFPRLMGLLNHISSMIWMKLFGKKEWKSVPSSQAFPRMAIKVGFFPAGPFPASSTQRMSVENWKAQFSDHTRPEENGTPGLYFILPLSLLFALICIPASNVSTIC